MKKFIPFLFIIFVLLFSACKKKVSTISIPVDLKKYSVFSVGSYWVFDNGTKIDSSYLKSIQSQYQHKSDGMTQTDDYIYERCDIQYAGNFITGSLLNFVEGWSGYIYYIQIDSISYPCLSSLSYEPNKEWTIDMTYVLKNVNHFNSYTVNGVSFKDVMQTQCKINNIIFTFYLSPAVGLIKYNRSDTDTTWNLLRYHATQ